MKRLMSLLGSLILVSFVLGGCVFIGGHGYGRYGWGYGYTYRYYGYPSRYDDRHHYEYSYKERHRDRSGYRERIEHREWDRYRGSWDRGTYWKY